MRTALLLLGALLATGVAASKKDLELTVCKDAAAKLGLDVTGATVFCPTNGAFAEFARDLGFRGKDVVGQMLKVVPANTLKAVLSHHVVPGRVLPASSFKAGAATALDAADGGKLEVKALKGGKKLEVKDNGVDVDGDFDNDKPAAVGAGVDLTFEGPFAAGKSKYVVQPVDEVMVPPGSLAALKKVLAANLVGKSKGPLKVAPADLSVCKAALAKLDVDVAGATVFCPTDGGFVEFARDLGFKGADPVGAMLDAVPAATLKTVLGAHVVPGQLLTAAALSKPATLSTLAGAPLTAASKKGKRVEVADNGVDVDGDMHNDHDGLEIVGVDMTFEGPFEAGKSKYVVQPIAEVIVPPAALTDLTAARAKALGLAAPHPPAPGAKMQAVPKPGEHTRVDAVPKSALSATQLTVCQQLAGVVGLEVAGSTVFCPTNGAFGQFARDLGFRGADPVAAMITTVPTPTLKTVLDAHVVPGKLLDSAALKAKPAGLETAAGTKITVESAHAKKVVIKDNGVDVDGDHGNDKDLRQDVHGFDLTFVGPFVKGQSEYVVQAVDEVIVPRAALAELQSILNKNLAVFGGRRMLRSA
ncbi:MAG: hypothetical protein J3K34DRAFT_456224 [Monoraphidium minutum]|nr:MAG: hypothetical protein J3K34DRAFT_456224 [Monoraphidium minutum]